VIGVGAWDETGDGNGDGIGDDPLADVEAAGVTLAGKGVERAGEVLGKGETGVLEVGVADTGGDGRLDGAGEGALDGAEVVGEAEIAAEGDGTAAVLDCAGAGVTEDAGVADTGDGVTTGGTLVPGGPGDWTAGVDGTGLGCDADGKGVVVTVCRTGDGKSGDVKGEGLLLGKVELTGVTIGCGDALGLGLTD
jgi:hypothetical protein